MVLSPALTLLNNADTDFVLALSIACLASLDLSKTCENIGLLTLKSVFGAVFMRILLFPISTTSPATT